MFGIIIRMNMNADMAVDWASVTPETMSAKLDGLMRRAASAVAEVEAGGGTGYEDFAWPLFDATSELTRAWGLVEHMLGVMNTPGWRALEKSFQPKIVAFTLRVSQSRTLYDRARAVLAALPPDAPQARRRVLGKMILDARLAGVGLDGDRKSRFNEIQSELAELGSAFANSVVDATAAFKYEKDGRSYTIDDANYVETMRECPDREVRERLCRARATRAPENAARIGKILSLRREAAGLLGFDAYAGLSLATKCAPSVAAVMKMIDDLDAATVAAAEAEDAELAGMQPDGSGGVMPWDVQYLGERLRRKRYSYSEAELKRYFEFPAVLDGLFRITEFLFGVKVAECAGCAPAWHEDVRLFSVTEGGAEIARFYLDPYVRPGLKHGGAWMNPFVNRCDRRGESPVAVVVLNLKRPAGDGPVLMSMREVETLFHEFGHALQCMLTRIGEEGASGLDLVEWDAVEVASQFMENWCLDDRTGISMPPELKARVRAAKNFRAASACRRQLAFARTDMILHSAPVDDPDAVKRENFRHFGVPSVPGDLFLCGFTHIFGGGYAAGYYSYKWSEVMSADCYGAFEEAGLGDDGAVRRMGAKYRDTLLALGGSLGALDVFRLFRGRDPDTAALLRQRGLS